MRRFSFLLVAFTCGIAQAASSTVQVNYAAELITISGNPFGLSTADRNRVMTGKFVYDQGTRDTDPAVSYGKYQLNLSEAAFTGTLHGAVPLNFRGTGQANIEINDAPTGVGGDYFRFADGPDGAHPTRYMQVDGVANTKMTLWFHHQAGSNITIIDSAGLPNPYTWGVGLNFPHTFVIEDVGKGSILFQLLAIGASANQGLVFMPMSPCRLLDTRSSISIGANETRTISPQSLFCNVPTEALAYSLNLTVVPKGQLGYVTLYPNGQPQPEVSNLNSLDGRIKANAAIVKAGIGGTINLYATDATDVVLDINGYFAAPNPSGLYFYPLPPCRILDTRNATGPLGGPALVPLQARTVPVNSACNVPSNAQAYSLNATVVPSEPFGFLTLWPSGTTRPTVSTLNAVTGTVVANAAIVPAGRMGSIDVYGTNRGHLVLDINGYFAPSTSPAALKFVPVNPCRLSDSRLQNGSYTAPPLNANSTATHQLTTPQCNIGPGIAAATVNATVVPTSAFGYLTLFPAGQGMPVVSTLNALDGAITSNAAIVPLGTSGGIRAFLTDSAHLILDMTGYFAPY
jgi:hypothetical protein